MKTTGAVPRILLLDHRGQTVEELARYLQRRCALDRVHPEDARQTGSALAADYDGLVASGGFLGSGDRRAVLGWYSELFAGTETPFLGICLGLKILGHCYGARMRKIPPDVGTGQITFGRSFPLAAGVRKMQVYENHRFELVPPLPAPLENYASGVSPVQAVAVSGRSQFAVQFHPEVGTTATVVLDAFLRLCAAGRPKDSTQPGGRVVP